MGLKSFAGVIFDCDGVLVDSEQPWIALMEHYLTAMGLRGADGIVPESLRGLTASEAVDALAAAQAGRGSGSGSEPESEPGSGTRTGATAGVGFGNGSATGATASRTGLPTVAEVDAAYSSALEGLAAPMPGSVDLVSALSGYVPIAVASNGRRHDVQGLLKRAGLLNLFDTIVTIDDVEQGKPAPDAYLLAASRLGIDPHDVIVFEDSAPGASAGRSAGCTVIGVNAHDGAALPTHMNLRTLADLEYSVVSGSPEAEHAEGEHARATRARLTVLGPWDAQPANNR